MIVTLTITYDLETGQLKVDGPVADKVTSFGMMELAKAAINAAPAPQNQHGIVPVRADFSRLKLTP